MGFVFINLINSSNFKVERFFQPITVQWMKERGEGIKRLGWLCTANLKIDPPIPELITFILGLKIQGTW